MFIGLTTIDKDGVHSEQMDEVDIRESGQSIGLAIADVIDMALEDPKFISITIEVKA